MSYHDGEPKRWQFGDRNRPKEVTSPEQLVADRQYRKMLEREEELERIERNQLPRRVWKVGK